MSLFQSPCLSLDFDLIFIELAERLEPYTREKERETLREIETLTVRERERGGREREKEREREREREEERERLAVMLWEGVAELSEEG